MLFNVDRPQKVGSPCAIYQPHSKTSASRSSKPAVYEHMTETAPSCKTYLPTTRLHNTFQETPNPSIQPLRHPTRDSGNGVRPTLPTIINHSSVHSSAASPLPPAPASRLGCLPARSAGPEVVTQQLVPRTAHLAVLPSHTSVPEGAQQGRGKSSLLPAATCRPTS